MFIFLENIIAELLFWEIFTVQRLSHRLTLERVNLFSARRRRTKSNGADGLFVLHVCNPRARRHLNDREIFACNPPPFFTERVKTVDARFYGAHGGLICVGSAYRARARQFTTADTTALSYVIRGAVSITENLGAVAVQPRFYRNIITAVNGAITKISRVRYTHCHPQYSTIARICQGVFWIFNVYI